MDSALIPEGVKRCPLPVFIGGVLAVGGVLLWGIYAMLLCWIKGLNQTNMNDYYGFALWVWADLTMIALGGGAFFTGLLRYLIGRDELKNIINFAVVIGFVCYSSAMLILTVDIGQPLRGWFVFWHANVHSMLTEVAFCLTCYLALLTIEVTPLILENRQFGQDVFLRHLGRNMNKIMAVFAATGAYLSFFHQGSLGGMAGVLYGRPFSFREGALIWPTTFFLFVWSAAAAGPCFTILATKITEKITGKKLVGDPAIRTLAKISGWMMLTYIMAKIIDTAYWALVTAPKSGFRMGQFYGHNAFYGYWILLVEILVGGLLPALILTTERGRNNPRSLLLAAVLACAGIAINRWAMVLQVMAAPVLPFDNWRLYIPSWQEVATTILPVAYGVLLIALVHRYLPVFPQEKELNPLPRCPGRNGERGEDVSVCV